MAHHADLRPIHDVTDELGLDPSDVTVWGDGKARCRWMRWIDRLRMGD